MSGAAQGQLWALLQAHGAVTLSGSPATLGCIVLDQWEPAFGSVLVFWMGNNGWLSFLILVFTSAKLPFQAAAAPATLTEENPSQSLQLSLPAPIPAIWSAVVSPDLGLRHIPVRMRAGVLLTFFPWTLHLHVCAWRSLWAVIPAHGLCSKFIVDIQNQIRYSKLADFTA